MSEQQIILEMLKDGKISVEEAQRLLSLVGKQTPGASEKPTENKASQMQTDVIEEPFFDPDEIQRVAREASREATRLAHDAARQVRNEMKAVEQQLRDELRVARREAREAQREAQREAELLRSEADRLTQQARASASQQEDTTVRESNGFLDGLGNLFTVFERAPGFDIFGSNYRTETVHEGAFSADAMVDLPRNTYTPTDKQIRINVYTSNGRIIIHGWDEPTFRMTLNASIKASSAEEARAKLKKLLIVTDSPEMLYVDGRAFVGNNVGMNVELWLPRCYQYEMDLRGSNGRVTLEDFHAQGLEVKTSNGRLELTDVTAQVAKLRSSNGSIVCNTGIALLSAHSSNGSVHLRTSQELVNSFDISTTNGSIKIQVDDTDGLAHDLDLKTSGKIVVSLPGAISSSDGGRGGFEENRSIRLESLTSGFDSLAKRLRVSARTSVGSIRISNHELS